ncbi:uncharacterized protein K460DRAFT_407847 [Cucurbitaria berberidis CBS 394.84]|uniref:F-box domain-containing protein n=1 Tax=Cucurbitaria berberidis CBS 394.84 TaxID=1168544 RepID=A0A9P4GDB8_9PLEO|nr:uncharacterized protein K460DRAFT_407847 [Cucurbitaria berberidis CBS 394.84]KAF1843495.1 hypothetical protein K460DRAFT_407847 [Cucurbitaria berberidis CBS 394.84]
MASVQLPCAESLAILSELNKTSLTKCVLTIACAYIEQAAQRTFLLSLQRRRNSIRRLQPQTCLAQTPTVSDAVTVPALSTTDASQISFIHLPAELRNRVYQFAIADLPTPTKLRYTPLTTQAPRGYRALTTVCRQVRAEFLPLYMRSVKIEISLLDMPRFFQFFFPDTDERNPKPTNVTVMVIGADVSTYFAIEARFMLLAQAQTRDLELRFEPSYHYIAVESGGYYELDDWDSKFLADVFNDARKLHQKFHRDLERGYISSLTYNPSRWTWATWTLTILKEVGGLVDTEIEKLSEYASILYTIREAGIVRASVRVEGLEGKCVEEYTFEPENGLIKKRTGTSWR